jgi:hypothetical protein
MVDWVAVVLAKKETTNGTDAVPTGTANAVITRNFSGGLVEVDRIDRNLDNGAYGASPSAPSNERRTFSYEVEIAGSGAAGTAAAWMELLEGCGMATATLTATVDAKQVFAAPGSMSSITHYDFLQDQRRKGLGSVGTFQMDFTAGSYPFITFNWTALLPATTPFDKTAPGATTLTRWKQPVEVNNANTSFLLDTYAAKLKSWKADAGVNVALRNLVGSRYVRRGNHAVKSTLVIEATDIATKDYIATLRNGSLVAFLLTHGTVAGNIIEISSTKTQIISISESKEDDVVMWTMELSHTIDSGAADIQITAK